MFKKNRVDELEQLEMQLLEYQGIIRLATAALSNASTINERDLLSENLSNLKKKLNPEIAYIKTRIAYLTKERTDSKTIDPQTLKNILMK